VSINHVLVASANDETGGVYTTGHVTIGTYAPGATSDVWFEHLRVTATAPPATAHG